MNTQAPKAHSTRFLLPLLLLLLVACAPDAMAQGTAFKYEGRIVVTHGSPAAYDLEFKLYDAANGGTQQGPTLSFTNVQLAGDTYAVVLDFGGTPFAAGQPRFLEIGFKAAGSPDPFELISPRDPILSVPYAVRSLYAGTADDASKLGGVPAGDYVKTDDPRLSDERPPTPGSPYYIHNQTALQAGANFNIGGSGTAAGTLKGGAVDSATQYNLGGLRVLGSNLAQHSLFVGLGAGQTSAGFGVTAVGHEAGASNTAPANSFFGFGAGFSNTTGHSNTFAGSSAGNLNTTGANNSFFGSGAGFENVKGVANSFFGSIAGTHTKGDLNSFFGYAAGFSNTAGLSNVFVGAHAGSSNTDGSFNTYVGRDADGSASAFGATALGATAKANASNSTAVGTGAKANAPFSTAVGAGAKANAPHTVVLGAANDKVLIPGSLVVTGTVAKGGGSFKIDHPLDPENKYLSHSFVESPDMMNVYNGNVTTNGRGLAVVTLPDYFEALNRDFRYQLTVVGRFAQAIVLKEVSHNRFVIKTSRPGVKVSWQVTGIRQDAYANAHRIPTVEDKPAQERGTYLHPEAFRRRTAKPSAGQ